ncbi:MAG TPA: gamma-glutamyl-gamma-aminobutyrate hydrolase family protein [Streptosporangiaceae bacterium]|nr:gamma-glutamyl-gamma-aminobutyrate hydrolase family protein [Streptosporangiaceae bacterium]
MVTVNRDGEVGGAPLIGISAYCEQARWGVWETQAMVLPRRYADRVSAAGGIPVLLPPVPDVEEALGQLDGLMLSGGGDIDPARYGAQPAPETGSVRDERDSAEFALFATALERRLPVLGICRGMQIINVARGGSLHQHLPAVVGNDGHAQVPGAFGSHPVRVTPGSRLAGILGRDKADVPTHHHQAVDRLGDGLTATAWTPDGTIEAFELDAVESPFVLAVQWHPEAGDDLSLFRALVAAARDRSPAAAPA